MKLPPLVRRWSGSGVGSACISLLFSSEDLGGGEEYFCVRSIILGS
jgi:hypothetical protein